MRWNVMLYSLKGGGKQHLALGLGPLFEPRRHFSSLLAHDTNTSPLTPHHQLDF